MRPDMHYNKAVDVKQFTVSPPSFPDSRFDVVVRRQRPRPKTGGGIKLTTLPSRFLNLESDFQFAGWGSFTRLSLEKDDRKVGEDILRGVQRKRVLGQFTATALPGNAVLGGVFYALPAVVAVSSV